MVGLDCDAGRCLAPDGLNSRSTTPARPPSRGETSATCHHVTSRHHERRMGDGPHAAASSIPCNHEMEDAMPAPQRRRVTRVAVHLCHAVSDDVNATLLQHTPNLLNIIHIHTGNTDATVELAVTVLNNFDLKRDAVQTKNDLPAQ